jgi:hypothetical protein
MPKKLLFLAFIMSFFLLTASATYGALLTEPHGENPGCPPGYSGNCGNYSLDDFTLLAINASRIVMGFVGTLALLMFVYGGVLYLVSAGSSETVKKATNILIAAIIGLVIVFTSFIIIKFVLKSMGIEWNGGKLTIAAVSSPIVPSDKLA